MNELITNVGGKCKVCGQEKRPVLSFRDVFYECDCNTEKATSIKPSSEITAEVSDKIRDAINIIEEKRNWTDTELMGVIEECGCFQNDGILEDNIVWQELKRRCMS